MFMKDKFAYLPGDNGNGADEDKPPKAKLLKQTFEHIMPEIDVFYIDKILLLINGHFTGLSLLIVVFFAFFRDIRAFRYSALCAMFYIWGNFTYPIIMKFDYSVYIYRYIYWAFSDIAFMAILAYFTLKDKVYLWQGIVGQIIVLPAPLLQLFRLVDRHFLDLSYSTHLYKTILPLVNTLSILICLLPVFYVVKNKLRAFQTSQ